jgi:hypothetical protein
MPMPQRSRVMFVALVAWFVLWAAIWLAVFASVAV